MAAAAAHGGEGGLSPRPGSDPLDASAAGRGAAVPLQPRIWKPGLALPCAARASEPSPVPSLLLVDRRDPPVQVACSDLEALLNPEERHRRDRFRLEADRHRYLLGRGVLRLVLGAWLGCDPAALVFRYGPHGKPALVWDGPDAPHFNLAHSGDLVLLAFHPTAAVGVDVERLRPDLDWQPLARRLLPPQEREALDQVPADARPAAFLAAWCCLEARLKVRGEGFAGLERLQAEARAGRDPVSERIWPVAVPHGHVAAVAAAV